MSEHSVKRILVPTDFSETSSLALGWAITFAKKFDAEITLVHVLFDESQVVSFYLPQVTLANLGEELEEGAKAQFDVFVKDNPDLEKVKYETKLLKGSPFMEIIREARDQEADMIVIGTHGRTGLEHVLFGSTAEKVVRKAPCAVFTVSPEGRTFTLP